MLLCPKDTKMAKKFWDAPRDSETIPRSILRKIHPQKPRSSYPLLSGDTFMSMCQLRFNESGEVERNPFFDKSFSDGIKVFAHAFPESRAAVDLRVNMKSNKQIDYSELELIIHNGDVIPPEEDFEFLSGEFKKVHSVNWLGDPNITNPLPIGLENFAKLRNGVPKDYSDVPIRKLKSFQDRDIELLVCFSLHTNRKERTLALQASRNISGSYVVLEPITPRAYRKLLLRSKYVLSPPGNGPDCHRTWEAIYLGATPIVLESAWPMFRYQLPVLPIMEWGMLTEVIPNHDYQCRPKIPSPEVWLS
jgi:hypothetical protein